MKVLFVTGCARHAQPLHLAPDVAAPPNTPLITDVLYRLHTSAIRLARMSFDTQIRFFDVRYSLIITRTLPLHLEVHLAATDCCLIRELEPWWRKASLLRETLSTWYVCECHKKKRSLSFTLFVLRISGSGSAFWALEYWSLQTYTSLGLCALYLDYMQI